MRPVAHSTGSTQRPLARSPHRANTSAWQGPPAVSLTQSAARPSQLVSPRAYGSGTAWILTGQIRKIYPAAPTYRVVNWLTIGMVNICPW